MTLALPSILILADDAPERDRIVALVREAGLQPLPASDPTSAKALLEQACHGAIIALGDTATRACAVELRPAVPHILAVLDDHAGPIEDPDVIVVRRPLDQRELFEAILALALCGGAFEVQGESGSSHFSAAEFGIVAAKLACMAMREG